jgi:hypothetical protein
VSTAAGSAAAVGVGFRRVQQPSQDPQDQWDFGQRMAPIAGYFEEPWHPHAK